MLGAVAAAALVPLGTAKQMPPANAVGVIFDRPPASVGGQL